MYAALDMQTMPASAAYWAVGLLLPWEGCFPSSRLAAVKAASILSSFDVPFGRPGPMQWCSQGPCRHGPGMQGALSAKAQHSFNSGELVPHPETWQLSR